MVGEQPSIEAWVASGGVEALVGLVPAAQAHHVALMVG